MRQILGVVCLALSVLTISVWTNLLLHRRGYRKGYDEGHKAADNWWLEIESEAGQARQQIWREEEKRG